MGSNCSVAVTASQRDERLARRAIAAARIEIAACERAFSRFDSSSDLSRANANAGAWVRVDRRLVDLVAAALRAREVTRGRFDPTILPALVAAGYDGPFDRLRAGPPRDIVGRASGGHVGVDVQRARIRVDGDTALDLGGIAKGWSADRVLRLMRLEWPAIPGGLVDLGGDLCVWGATPDGGPWRVAVTDPRDHGRTLDTLMLSGGGVATSGRDRRRFGPGRTRHHLIDPTTGRSAVPGPLAATVVGGCAHDSEVHATVLATCDSEAAAGYLIAYPGVGALLVPSAGPVIRLGTLAGGPMAPMPMPNPVSENDRRPRRVDAMTVAAQ